MAKGFSNPDQAVCVAGACQLTTTVQVLSLNCVNSTCTTSCTSACQSTFGLSCNDTVHCDNGTVAGGSCADYDYFNADNQLTPCDAVANDGWVQGFACDTVPPSTNGCEIAGTYSQGAVLTEVDCMCTGTATF
jgi:hypothetical protein